MNDQTPDIYFPLFGPAFIAAVEGHSNDVVAAYIFALLNYWHVSHCQGLRDDDEWLRKVCRQDRDDWPQVGPVVFGGFFHKEGGLWHQKRAKEEWEKSKKVLHARRLGAWKTNVKRYGMKGPPPKA